MNIHPSYLGKKIADTISSLLVEEVMNKPIVVFPGRFQPMHIGHYKLYRKLIEKFGVDRVFIGTGGKVDENNPFSFDEKKKIMVDMFKIPPQQIVQVSSPYAPKEITAKFPKNTPLILAISDKDAERTSKLFGKYMAPYTGDDNLLGYFDRGYVLSLPSNMNDDVPFSSTDIRNVLNSPLSPEEKAHKLQSFYPGIPVDSIKNAFSVDRTSSKIEPPPNDDIQLNRKIINPVTGNKILVKTALKYGSFDKNHPAYIEAMKLLNRTRQENLTEGGAAGHLMHPYENVNLSFDELKSMIFNGLEGDFGGSATEKLDGQNIMVTVKNGKIRFARNKSHLKNSAENSLTVDQLRELYLDRPILAKSFGEAADDLQAALSKLSPEDVQSMFKEGSRFVNLEIINPDMKNDIPYDKKILIMHNFHEIDNSGNTVFIDNEAGNLLFKKLQSINANKQKEYGIGGPNFIVFSDEESEKYKKISSKLKSSLDEYMASENLNGNNTIADFMAKKWNALLQEESIPISDEVRELLIQRWVYGDKSSIGSKNFSDPNLKNWFREMDSKSSTLKETFLKPIKTLILQVGAASLQRAANLLSSQNLKAGQELRKELIDTINKIKQLPDFEKLDAFQTQLEYLNDVGLDSLIPSEGLVFTHNGQPYKFTGAFAPAHQILSMLKYRKTDSRSAPSSEQSEPSSIEKLAKTSTVDQTKKSVSDILNKKIKNSETGNYILVKTALSYPEDHPAHIVARKMIGENIILEGGNQFDQVNSAVPRNFIPNTVKSALSFLGLDLPFSVVGSTEKEISGDLDVAIDIRDFEKAIGKSYDEAPKEFWNEVQRWLQMKSAGRPTAIQKGFKQFSILSPLVNEKNTPSKAITSSGKEESSNGFVQVDFFVGNRKWMEKIMAGSPDSKYKAVYRNILLKAIISNIGSPDDVGYSLDFRDGLFVGKYVEEKKGKRQWLDKKLLTDNPDKMVEFLFGSGVMWRDVDTFEKLKTRLDSPQFKFSKKLPSIYEWFSSALNKMKLDGMDVNKKTEEKPLVVKTDTSQKVQDKRHQVFGDVMIINPATKNKIKIKTALSYPENHPAHIAARRYISDHYV